jgi:hypothetical protein
MTYHLVNDRFSKPELYEAKETMTEKQAYQAIDDLYEQLRSIELNPKSYLGGIQAYTRGHVMYYTRSAEKKISDIKDKIIHLEQFITEV